jgi:hypothetical protein
MATTAQLPTEPGYLMTLRLGSHDYKIFAYTTNGHGQKKYLPSNCDPQSFERIRSLTWGLLNAHEARRAALNEPAFQINTITSKGLARTNNTLASHDFLIQPHSQLTADQMASAITLAGEPMQAAAVKAQDVWNTLEKTVRQEMGRPANPIDLSSTTVTPPVSTTSPTTQPILPPPSPAPVPPPSSPPPSASPAPAPVTTPPAPAPATTIFKPAVTATTLNLKDLPLEQRDWYERIPDRAKLRIITDILEIRGYSGGVHEKVWKLFESKVPGQRPVAIIDLLTREQRQLDVRCRAMPSAIPISIRQEGEQFLDAFHQEVADEALQEKILSLMQKEFARKEHLFQCIRQQAVEEGVAIENWDEQWAQYHFIESNYRFAQALARWLDNN